MTPNQQQQKDRARAEAEHHQKHSFVDRMVDSAKEAFNTRYDENTGRPYVKGKKGYTGAPDSVGVKTEYEDDPNL